MRTGMFRQTDMFSYCARLWQPSGREWTQIEADACSACGEVRLAESAQGCHPDFLNWPSLPNLFSSISPTGEFRCNFASEFVVEGPCVCVRWQRAVHSRNRLGQSAYAA